jgi:hypothetical protein
MEVVIYIQNIPLNSDREDLKEYIQDDLNDKSLCISKYKTDAEWHDSNYDSHDTIHLFLYEDTRTLGH